MLQYDKSFYNTHKQLYINNMSQMSSLTLRAVALVLINQVTFTPTLVSYRAELV